jgi:hypothetical protein
VTVSVSVAVTVTVLASQVLSVSAGLMAVPEGAAPEEVTAPLPLP